MRDTNHKSVMSYLYLFKSICTLDFTRYDGPVTSSPEVKRFQRMNLSNFQNRQINKSVKADKSVKLRLKTNKSKLTLALIIVTSVITQGNTYAVAAKPSSDHYKLYLHSKIINYNQFICAVEVAHRESRWNWRSTNGNHFGLFQMENRKVKYMNAYTQIDWWLRYVDKRYKGQPCLSLKHLKKVGWQ